MRILHTSDWHLGRSFHGVGLLEAQAVFLDDLVEVCRSERVAAVLVSGDVYDRALPSPDTVEVLSDAVTRLVTAGTRVVLSSGNHDSAIRLGFAADLLAQAGLHIRTSIARIGTPVLLDDVAIHPLPYLEPALVAESLGTDRRSHEGVLRAAMERVRRSLASHPGPSIVMAHAFVTGAATSDSERDITVGGVASVHPDVFSGVSYAALGHLHGRQHVSENVRYSGSPLAMSFGEAGHHKGSWLLELDGDGVRSVEAVPAPVPRPLAVLRGDLDDLLLDPAHVAAERAWCQVTLTDPVPPLAAMDRLRARFPHTLDLRLDPQGTPRSVRTYAERVRARDDVDICCDFLTHVRGGHAATDDERALLREALEGGRLAASDDEGVATLPGLRTTGAA